MREGPDALTSPVNFEKLSETARIELARQHADAALALDDAENEVRAIRRRYDVGTATASELEAATTRARRAEQRMQELQRMAGGGQARGAAQGAAGGRGGGNARAGTTFAR